MASFSCSIDIAASSDAVFELFSDIARAPEYVQSIDRIEVLDDGPVGVGTRFRETRRFFNREATEEMVFTEFERPRHYRVECRSHGAHYVSDFEFEPAGDQTRVQVLFQVHPESVLARLLSPLSGLMLKPVRQCTERDLADLKAHAEANRED